MALIGAGSSLGGLAGGNITARLVVAVSGNTAQLQSALAGASGSLESFNKSAGRLGSVLTRSVTLPILGLGAAAIALAAGFEQALARVAGLTPILDESGKSIDQIGESLLAISKEVPTAPKELADALYFAGSAGLSFSEAMDVVKLSAKGAAIGMGDAADISKVLIFALNAFRGQGLTAASAMDTLTVAIREGTAEPADLAIALGRLLPVAKASGIAFSEVVASVAALTNIGLPTRVAVTSLRALFTELLAPTKQANDALKALGLTAQEVRDAVSAGPVVAMNLLINATHGNIDALHQIVPQIRGFTALLGLTGDQAIRVSEIFDKTKNSTGALEHAFEIMSKTTAFKFQVALNDLRIAGIELGRKLLPVFDLLVAGISSVANMFTTLSSVGKTSVAAFLLIAAAAGPLIKIWASLTNAGKGLFTNFTSVATGITLMSAAAVIGVLSFSDMASGVINFKNVLLLGISAFVAAKLAIAGLTTVIGLLAAATKSAALDSLWAGLATHGLALAAAIAVLALGIAYMVGKSHEGGRAAGKLRDSLVALGGDAVLTGAVLRKLAADNAYFADSLSQVAKEVNAEGKPALQGYSDLLQGTNKDVLKVAQTLLKTSKQVDYSFYSPDQQTELQGYIDALRMAEGQNISVGDAIRRAGLNEQHFLDLLAGAPAAPGTQQLQELVRQSDALAVAQKEVADQTQAKLTIYAADKAATAQLAKNFGVSTDYIIQKTQEQGVSAVGLTDTITGETTAMGEQFAKQAGFRDTTSGEIIAADQEMAEAEAKLVADRQEAMLGTFELFAALPEKVKQSTDKLLVQLDRQEQFFVDEAANVQTLLQRGLDPAVLQKLVDKGPEFVAKFVNASKGELTHLENAYNVTLAAIDAAVLQEGDHQVGKAENMIGSFARVIFSNRDLPVNAMKALVNEVVNAVDNNKIGQKGLDLITTFAAEVTGEGALNLTGNAAATVVAQFTNMLLSGKSATGEAGVQVLQEFANGLLRNKTVPAEAIAGIINTMAADLGLNVVIFRTPGGLAIREFVSGLEGKKKMAQDAAANISDAASYSLGHGNAGARSAGGELVANFAAGITANLASAQQAAIRLGDVTVAALNASLQNSPKLFTWYLGQKVTDEFAKGLAVPKKLPSLQRPGLTIPQATGQPGGAPGSITREGDTFHIYGSNVGVKEMFDEVDWRRRTSGRGVGLYA